MKKLALAICLLLASIAAQAQFEKGTMILNRFRYRVGLFLTVKMMMLNLGSARKPVHFWQTVLH